MLKIIKRSTVAKDSIYVETSVVSYLTSRPSSDLLASAWQKATVDWWETQRSRFDLYTSEVVLEEAARGETEAAARRLEALSGIAILEINEAALALSKALLQEGALPVKALNDSLHVAVSAVHGIDYLLTWNFRHLDNAEIKPLIRRVCISNGHACPEICTPQELMGRIENG
jgi:predicted nucleic acid-binding protein